MEENTQGISIVMPSGANESLADPYLLGYYKDAEHRVYYLEDQVTEETMDLVKIIYRCNYEDDKEGITPEDRIPIKIMIDTVGGDLFTMIAIVNAIRISKTPVYTIVISKAMSAGSYILVAGHKRFAIKGSTVLIHSGSSSLCGTQEQVESAQAYYKRVDKIINQELLDATSIKPKTFKAKAPVDWYLTADEALENGVVDKVLDGFEEIF